MAGAGSFSAGNDAFVDEEYCKAKEKYTEAIELEPENPAYYLKRSICNFKLQDFAGSALDAEKATNLDANNIKAFLRLGLAKFQLKEFICAKKAFQSVLALDSENKEASGWIEKCDANIPAVTDKVSSSEDNNSVKICDESTSLKPKEEQPSSKSTIKHDWYQTETHVVLTLMVKNRRKEDVEIEFGNQNVSLTVKLSSDSDYNWELDLAHPIDPANSVMRILSTKVEIKMKKVEGIRWTSLERKDEPVFAKLEEQDENTNDASARQYPTSSRKHHDWDKLAAEIEKDESEEKKEGDAALNELFQKIYANADEDTKRAMNKSYQESGGTVLSTNWKDIGKKKVECKPPDGMEFKKYEL